MSPESLQLAQSSLRKASSDLAAARILIRGDHPYLDIAAYHCQQGAEKAFKAYLTSQETIFPKTHILERLVELCSSSTADFEQFQPHAKELTPLSDEFRYPGDTPDPTPQEAEHALALAEEIYRFCAERLGDERAES